MYILKDKQLNVGFNKTKTLRISELMYLFSLSVYLIVIMLDTTMFRVYLNYRLLTLINVVVSGIVILKIIFFDKEEYKEKKNCILPVILFLVSDIIFIKTKYYNLFYLPIFIVGAKNIDFRKMCKVYLFIGISITLISMLAVNFNIIEHIVYFRDGKPRYSFGSVYATDFAARIFYLCIIYCYIKYKDLNIKDSILFLACMIFVFIFCDARLDSICIFMISLLPFLMKSKGIYLLKNRFIKYILIWCIPIFTIISILLSYIYDENNKFMVLINKILSNRLSLGKKGINEYGFSLFGKVIEMKGNGGVNNGVTNYFFIDCSYLHIALRYGIIILFIICILYTYFNKMRIQNNDLILPYLIFIVGINSIVAHHFIDIRYNFLILIFFTDIYNGNTNGKKISYKYLKEN